LRELEQFEIIFAFLIIGSTHSRTRYSLFLVINREDLRKYRKNIGAGGWWRRKRGLFGGGRIDEKVCL
jgi:hypothetical protein